METPKRTDVKSITGRAQKHSILWSEDVVDGAGDNTHDSKHAVQDTASRISERDIYGETGR